MSGDQKPHDEGPSLWAHSGRAMGLGLQWALSTLLFLLGGWWLDGKLGTGPVLLIVGAFVGGTAGFYSLYHRVMTGARETQDEEDR